MRIDAQDLAAFSAVVEGFFGCFGVAGAAVEIAAIKGDTLARMGEFGVVRFPTGAVFKIALGVVAQDAAVVGGAVVAGVKVDVAPIKSAAVKAGGVQAVGIAGVEGFPAAVVAKVFVGIKAQDAAVY